MTEVVRHETKHRRALRGLAAAPATLAIGLALLAICCIATSAIAADDLYRVQTVVTGQGEANRNVGFAACLEDVLIKVSGAQQLAGDPRLAPHKSRARDFVRTFFYHDQFSGKPIRDEQGTRDRPYDLTVDFDRTKIDDLLKALGLKPWLSPRPRLAVFVEMQQGPRRFIVTAGDRQSDLQRDALLAAADKRGMDVVLPEATALAKSGLAGVDLKTVQPTMTSFAAQLGGDVALIGRLVWDDRELGWATEWRIDWQDRTYRWQLRGVTFDEAFRRGVGGSAQVLSGNGRPS